MARRCNAVFKYIQCIITTLTPVSTPTLLPRETPRIYPRNRFSCFRPGHSAYNGLKICKTAQQLLVYPVLHPKAVGGYSRLWGIEPQGKRVFPIANWRHHVHTPSGCGFASSLTHIISVTHLIPRSASSLGCTAQRSSLSIRTCSLARNRLTSRSSTRLNNSSSVLAIPLRQGSRRCVVRRIVEGVRRVHRAASIAGGYRPFSRGHRGSGTTAATLS
jgi:hypothetical protein